MRTALCCVLADEVRGPRRPASDLAIAGLMRLSQLVYPKYLAPGADWLRRLGRLSGEVCIVVAHWVSRH